MLQDEGLEHVYGGGAGFPCKGSGAASGLGFRSGPEARLVSDLGAFEGTENEMRSLHALFCLLALPAQAALDPASLPAVGFGLDGVSYYASYSPFSDAMKAVRWINVAAWNEKGFPTAAVGTSKVEGRVGVDNGQSWPTGEYVLKWKGSGEVILNRPTGLRLIEQDLTGAVKRRVYAVDATEAFGLRLRIESFPVDDIQILLPGLENHPSLWNPAFLEYLKPFRGTVLRFMDMNGTNSSTQQHWADRVPRNWSSYANGNAGSSAAWPVRGKVAYEAMIELCNEVGADMWLCTPHLATDLYLENLARLILTGVDPVSGERTTDPLRPGLRVWLEYSNEVWNWNFAQSNWTNDNVPGNALDDRYTRQAVRVFEAFEQVFGGTERLVRVIGTQTGWTEGWRSRQRLRSLRRDQYDVLAITTYYSHRIQEWLYENRATVTLDQALDELSRRVGFGPYVTSGPGEHQNNINSAWHFEIAREFGDVPVVAYEGGDHINAVARVGPNNRPLDELWPASVDFIHSMVRHPRMADIYTQNLERNHLSGLRTNVPFVLVAGWSKYGQWGHVEFVGQTLQEATKYRAVLEYYRLSPLRRFADWEARFLTPSERTDPSQAGPSGTLGGSGPTNLARYLFGLERGHALPLQMAGMEAGQVVIQYRRNREAIDYTVFLEESADGVHWDPLPSALADQAELDGGGASFEVYRLRLPSATGVRLLRLRADPLP